VENIDHDLLKAVVLKICVIDEVVLHSSGF
jgi:hypothetical protein